MNLRLVDPLGDPAGISPSEFETLGAYLRALREHKGLTLEKVAEVTRVQKAHLQAIEETNLSALPSRPFATGYVRAFAQALDLDPEAAAARFRRETPDYAEPLRAPIGVKHETRRRNPFLWPAIGLVVAAVVGWNVTQHAGVEKPRKAPPALPAAPAARPKPPEGVIALGAATPPPPDQTMPAPYVTPGLQAPGTPQDGAGIKAQAATPAGAAQGYAGPPEFVQKGEIFGAATSGADVLLQAARATPLIVRGAGGAVYFARSLRAGEAYRAPVGRGLVVEAADTGAVWVYVAGRLQAPLAAPLSPVDKIYGSAKLPEPPPTPAAAAPPAVGAGDGAAPAPKPSAAKPGAPDAGEAAPAAPAAQTPSAAPTRGA